MPAALCGALIAQAVNLKPGKYEFVSTSQVSLPPAMARQVPPGFLARVQQPRTHQTCISDTDLAQVSKQLSQERQADASCKMTAHTLTGNKVRHAMPACELTLRRQLRLRLVQGGPGSDHRQGAEGDGQPVRAADRGLRQIALPRAALIAHPRRAR
jgi:hypothetical protein